ncbi:MAG: S41 family peptidase [Thermoguttaceae bacterium]|jgi:carboxyl-terminal processing protease
MFRRTSPLLLALAAWALLISRLAAAPSDKPAPPKEDYYELYKMLADTMDQVDRNYVKEVNRRELMEAAIKGVLNRLDPYSAYIGPAEVAGFRSSVESEFGGIGIHLSTDMGDLRVLSPIYGSPAYRAGILAGDRIIQIDGKGTDGLSGDEAISRLKGPEGSRVTLTVVHPGSNQRHRVTLTREMIRVETVLGDHRKPDDTWDFMLDPQAHIGYVRVSAFSRETGNELRKALQELQSQKLRGLVLDLRFNPGGLLNSAIEVSNLFISKGRIVSTKGRNTPEHVWDARKGGAFEGFPMVVLVNHYSASASEIVAACLQDHKRAVIMGERSWGKGSVQNIIDLEDGRSALKLTTAAFHRPSGKNIHRFPDSREQDEWGVMPDPGFDCRLTDRETAGLLAERQRRDILQPGPAGPAAKAAAAMPDETAKPAPAVKPDPTAKPAPAAKPETTAKPAPAAKPDETAKPQTSSQPAAAPGPAGKPAAEPRPSGAGNTAKPAQPNLAAAEARRPPVVDRQLQMALKYLGTELARAK